MYKHEQGRKEKNGVADRKGLKLAWPLVAHHGHVVLTDQCATVGNRNTRGAETQRVCSLMTKVWVNVGLKGAHPLFLKFSFN